MKHILLFIVCFGCLSATAFAHGAETFDIITFTTPIGWQKQPQDDQNFHELGIEDEAKGIGCVIVMVKPVPGSDDSKVNFETAWETIVKKVFTITSGKPDIRPYPNINGWTAETGFGQAEIDGYVGLLMLLTLSGNNKMVNIITVTRTDACDQNVTTFLDSIRLPELAATNSPSSHHSATQARPSGNSNFTFATTDFNDGWKATEQSDWVHVSKGNTVVLIHHAQPDLIRFNNYMPFVWDTIVAPRYSNLSNPWIRKHWWSDGHEAKDFAEADAIENATGRQVHVVLYRNGNGRRWIEFITPDRESFQNQFAVVYEREGTDWDKLSALGNYNRFAVAVSDLPGTWKSSTTGGNEYNLTSHTDEFIFRTGDDYTSNYKGVDNSNYYGDNFEGKYTVSGLEMKLTNRERGDTETYDIHFEAVKGSRILHMNRTSPFKGLDRHLLKVK